MGHGTQIMLNLSFTIYRWLMPALHAQAVARRKCGGKSFQPRSPTWSEREWSAYKLVIEADRAMSMFFMSLIAFAQFVQHKCAVYCRIHPNLSGYTRSPAGKSGQTSECARKGHVRKKVLTVLPHFKCRKRLKWEHRRFVYLVQYYYPLEIKYLICLVDHSLLFSQFFPTSWDREKQLPPNEFLFLLVLFLFLW